MKKLISALTSFSVEVDENISAVNKEGSVNLKDVVLLRRYIAGGFRGTL